MSLPDNIYSAAKLAVSKLLADEDIPTPAIPIDPTGQPEQQELIRVLNTLLQQVQEEQKYLKQIAVGDLTATPPQNNPLGLAAKQIHVELTHLAWQLERLAAGDLQQQIDFSAMFAGPIHTLTETPAQV